MSEAYRVFGSFLKTIRKQSGKTQADLASSLGFKSPQYISNIERGINGLSLDYLQDIADICEVPSKLVFDFYVKCESERVREKIESKYGSLEGVA